MPYGALRISLVSAHAIVQAAKQIGRKRAATPSIARGFQIVLDSTLSLRRPWVNPHHSHASFAQSQRGDACRTRRRRAIGPRRRIGRAPLRRRRQAPCGGLVSRCTGDITCASPLPGARRARGGPPQGRPFRALANGAVRFASLGIHRRERWHRSAIRRCVDFDGQRRRSLARRGRPNERPTRIQQRRASCGEQCGNDRKRSTAATRLAAKAHRAWRERLDRPADACRGFPRRTCRWDFEDDVRFAPRRIETHRGGRRKRPGGIRIHRAPALVAILRASRVRVAARRAEGGGVRHRGGGDVGGHRCHDRSPLSMYITSRPPQRRQPVASPIATQAVTSFGVALACTSQKLRAGWRL